MIEIEFREEAIDELRYQRFHHPHPRVQRKMEALLLKSDGLRPRKVGMIPAKADVEEQERFKKRELEPRLQEARENERIVYFVDAAHFVLAPFLGYLWTRVRRFIRAPADRRAGAGGRRSS